MNRIKFESLRTIDVIKAMHILDLHCRMYPTCDGCILREKHKGCYFREGKTPREWGLLK